MPMKIALTPQQFQDFSNGPGKIRRSIQYSEMERKRRLMRLLDDENPDGGAARLESNPGRKITEEVVAPLPPDNTMIPDQNIHSGRAKPLLLQFKEEENSTFFARAWLTSISPMLAECIKSIAALPLSRPILINNAPEVLIRDPQTNVGGEWRNDIDGNGTSMESFLQSQYRKAARYELTYVRITANKSRATWDAISAEFVIKVKNLGGNRKRYYIVEQEESKSNNDPLAIETIKYFVSVYEDGDKDTGKFATLTRYKINSDKLDFSDLDVELNRIVSGEASVDNDFQNSLTLEPFFKAPIHKISSSPVGSGDFVLPSLHGAADLTWVLLQMSSNSNFAATVYTFPMLEMLGFESKNAKEQASNLAPAAVMSSPQGPGKASVKWFEVQGTGIKISLDQQAEIHRKLEIACHSPYLKSHPGTATATQVATETAESDRPINAIIESWQSDTEILLQNTALVANRIKPNEINKKNDRLSIKLHQPSSVALSSLQAIQEMSTAYKDGAITSSEYRKALRESGLIPHLDERKNIPDIDSTQTATMKTQRLEALIPLLSGANLGLARAALAEIQFMGMMKNAKVTFETTPTMPPGEITDV